VSGWFAAGRPAGNVLAQLASHVVTRAVLLGSTIAVAGAVGVADFGVFALALVFYQAGLLLRDAGLGQALIILGSDNTHTTRRAFLTGSAFGIGLGVVIAVLSGPATAALGLPASAPFVRILALAFAIGSTGVAPNAALERGLRFTARAVIDVSSYLALAVVTAIGLMLGWGALALAWGYVAQGSMQAILALLIQPPWRTGEHEAVPLGSFARYGGLLWASALLAYLAANVDNLAVAVLGGASAIGTYALSYTLGTTITISLAQVLNRVALPYYARAADGETRLEVFRSVAPLSMALGIFAAAPVIVLAPEVRHELLGPTAPAAPLAILAAYGVVRAVGIALGTALNGSGEARSVTVSGTVNVALIVILIVPGYLIAGLVGVALVCLTAMVASLTFLRGPIRRLGASLTFLGLPSLGLLLLVLLVIGLGGPTPLIVRVAAGIGAMILAAAWAWRTARGGGMRFGVRGAGP
jgi:O-antigen/teichoic acid export membrane protein